MVKKMANWIRNKLVVSVCTMIGVSFLLLFNNSFAFAEESEPFAIISSYEVSGDIIIPGESFDLSLVLENPSSETLIHGVMVNVTNESGITPVYPSVSQEYIGDMEPGEKRQLTFSMNVAPHYSSSIASFYVSIESSKKANYVVISAPVETNSDMFSISSKVIPSSVKVGQLVSSSVSFKSLSDENLSNIVLNVYVNGEQVSTNSIGNLFAGASKTQNSSFYLNEAGHFSIVYELECMDSDGLVHLMRVYDDQIDVEEVESDDIDAWDVNSSHEKELSQDDVMIISGCLFGSVLLIIGIVLIVRKANRRRS